MSRTGAPRSRSSLLSRRVATTSALVDADELLEVTLHGIRIAWLNFAGIASELLLAAPLPQQVPELVQRHLDHAQLLGVMVGALLHFLFLGNELRDPVDQVAVVHVVLPSQLASVSVVPVTSGAVSKVTAAPRPR